MKPVKIILSLFLSAGLALAIHGQEAAKAESKKKKLADRIRMVLKFGNSEQVRDTIKKIDTLKTGDQKEFIPELKKLLSSKDVLIQASVARYVSQAEFSDLDNDLLKVFGSELPEVESAVLAAIEKRKIKAAEPLLVKKVKQLDYAKPGRFSTEYIRLLGVFKNQANADFLFQKLKEDGVAGQYKQHIMMYFGNGGVNKPVIVKHLREYVMNEQASLKLRPYAAYALGLLKVSAAAADLKKLLDKIDKIADIDEKKRYARLRLHTITALVRLGDSEVMNVLMTMARDDDYVVRVSAIRQLGRLKNSQAVELLEFKEKYDPNAGVRKAAKQALEKIQGKSAVAKEKGKAEPANGANKAKASDNDKKEVTAQK